MLIGIKIRDYRNKLNITQKELAQKAEISLRALSNYENGLREPSMEVIIKIARALEVPVEKIQPDLSKSSELAYLLSGSNRPSLKDAMINQAGEPKGLSEEILTWFKEPTDKEISIKNSSITYNIGKVKGMLGSGAYSNIDIQKVVDHLYCLYKDRTSLDILKELIVNQGYETDNVDNEILNQILTKVSDVIELEFYKLDK